MERIEGVRWHAISALLDELIEADAQERSLSLSELSATDPALAESVALLLSYLPLVKAEHFLEGSAILPPLDPAGEGEDDDAQSPRGPELR